MPTLKSTDVDSNQISNIATSIDDDIKELLSICTLIEGDIMGNLDPYWQGQAKLSFEKKFKSYSINLARLVDGYQKINDQLKKTGIAYGIVDDTVKQNIAKMPR